MIKSFFLLFLFSFCSVLFPQHGLGSSWSPQVKLPVLNANAKQRGVLYNNIVTTSSGRIIVSTTEINPNNMNQYYGHYITYSDDGGKTWLNPPKRFTPIDLVTGGNGLKLNINKSDTIFAIWTSANPSVLYMSILDKNLNIIKDSIRVASKINYAIGSTNLTIDRYNRIHIMWNEGSTGSLQTTECYYTRSTNGGNSFEPVKLLSVNDGKHSAFPHAQFDSAGDTLAIPWRDSTGGVNRWDVQIVFSTDGGQNWSQTPVSVLNGPDSEWDPDLIIDSRNRIHLFYTVYPANNPFNGARNYYIYSDDVGVTWKRSQTPASGMISADYRSQLLEGTRYDMHRDILYTTWKDERDFNFTTGAVKGDIMLSYSTDRGVNWSVPEFVTDAYDTTAGFKAGELLPTGEYCINYELIYPEDINSPSSHLAVYFRKRSTPVTAVSDETLIIQGFSLSQNYPNPFNPITNIRFSVGVPGMVSLRVYDILGNVVANLSEGFFSEGTYSVNFDGSNYPSGVYFYVLTAGETKIVKKLTLLK